MNKYLCISTSLATLLMNTASSQMPLSFETQRLHAEKVTDRHVHFLDQILHDPQVQVAYNTTDIETFTNVPTQLEIIRSQWDKYGYGLYALFHKENSEFVGFAGFHAVALETNNTVNPFASNQPITELEIYALLVPGFWRQGYGFEIFTELIKHAFKYLSHTSIIAYAEPTNLASIKLIQKLNFKKEREVLYNNKLHFLYRLNKRVLQTNY